MEDFALPVTAIGVKIFRIEGKTACFRIMRFFLFVFFNVGTDLY